VIMRDNRTMKLQVIMFDNWHLHLRGLWKQVWARSSDSNIFEWLTCSWTWSGFWPLTS
jgi:hypothetical protein